MYHLRLKGTHYDMGVKRGGIFNKCGIRFPLHMDKFQLRHGIESEKLLQICFPEVCREVKGVTDTIGNDYTEFMSWMLAMGCCMYNLEENHPTEIRGCTAFAVNCDGHILYGRNNDLPPYLRDGSKSEIYAPENGYRFNITTSSFINGEEGMNEKGLIVAMTFVLTDLKVISAGFNSVFAVRYLLEKAGSTTEALAMLQKLPMASNFNILLADKTGDFAVAECSPNKMNIRRPTKLQNGVEVICTVNSFTSKEMKPLESHTEDDYRSAERYKTVMDAFAHYDDTELADYAISLLRGDMGFICQYPKTDCFETVWSSIFDPHTLSVKRAEGDPRRKKFTLDNRLIKKSNAER